MSRKIVIDQQGERCVVALTKKEISALASAWVNMCLIEGHPPSVARNLWLIEKSLADGLAPLESVLTHFVHNACDCGFAPIVIRKGGKKEIVNAGTERGSRWNVSQIKRADYVADIVAGELARAGRLSVDLMYSERFNPNRFEAMKAAGLQHFERLLAKMEKGLAELKAENKEIRAAIRKNEVGIYRLAIQGGGYDFVYNNSDDSPPSAAAMLLDFHHERRLAGDEPKSI